MAIQLSVAVRNDMLDDVENTIGNSPTMRVRTGAPPASCSAADTGTILAEITMPANWMNNASGGSKTKAGTWQTLTILSNGVAGHFRIYQGATAHFQGTITVSGGGGDMEVNDVNFTIVQQFTVTVFTLTAGNA